MADMGAEVGAWEPCVFAVSQDLGSCSVLPPIHILKIK